MLVVSYEKKNSTVKEGSQTKSFSGGRSRIQLIAYTTRSCRRSLRPHPITPIIFIVVVGHSNLALEFVASSELKLQLPHRGVVAGALQQHKQNPPTMHVVEIEIKIRT